MSIEEQVKAYISKELVVGMVDELEPNTQLIGLLDSTTIMELVVWIESKYQISVELDDITPENIGTIRAIAAYIERQTAKVAG